MPWVNDMWKFWRFQSKADVPKVVEQLLVVWTGFSHHLNQLLNIDNVNWNYVKILSWRQSKILFMKSSHDQKIIVTICTKVIGTCKPETTLWLCTTTSFPCCSYSCYAHTINTLKMHIHNITSLVEHREDDNHRNNTVAVVPLMKPSSHDSPTVRPAKLPLALCSNLPQTAFQLQLLFG